jgi:malate/lactate dehydrogenase
MKILVIGVGGVGEALAAIGQHRPWIEQWCWLITIWNEQKKFKTN